MVESKHQFLPPLPDCLKGATEYVRAWRWRWFHWSAAIIATQGARWLSERHAAITYTRRSHRNLMNGDYPAIIWSCSLRACRASAVTAVLPCAVRCALKRVDILGQEPLRATRRVSCAAPVRIKGPRAAHQVRGDATGDCWAAVAVSMAMASATGEAQVLRVLAATTALVHCSATRRVYDGEIEAFTGDAVNVAGAVTICAGQARRDALDIGEE